MDQLLTVMIQTSPIPSHPSTALLEALFRSFQKADGLLESRIVIVCDGCEEIIIAPPTTNGVVVVVGEKENNKHGKASLETAARYREHLTLLREAVMVLQRPPFVPRANGSIELLELSERHGSARGIQAVFSGTASTRTDSDDINKPFVVETPLVMICQHDNFFVQDVPLRACVHAMMDQQKKIIKQHESGSSPTGVLGNMGVKCLHFMSTATMNYKAKVKKRYGVDIREHVVQLNNSSSIKGAPPIDEETTKYKLVPLIFWYGRTHLSYTDHYTSKILNRPLKIGDHLEELLGVVELEDIRRRGMEEAHKDWGTFVLDQGCGEVIYHLSGRRARAATGIEASRQQQQQQAGDNHKQQAQINSEGISVFPTTFNEQPEEEPPSHSAGSFTTARSCRAIVPGLEIVSEVRSSKPQGKKFKQKCFHCGLKGHSYKFCPSMEDKPNTETIDLS